MKWTVFQGPSSVEGKGPISDVLIIIFRNSDDNR